MMIVAELLKIQKERKLTNRQMAEILGIHTISWYRIKRTKTIGADILLRAFGIFPELRDQFLSSFTNQQDKTTTYDEKPHNALQTALKLFCDKLHYLAFPKSK